MKLKLRVKEVLMVAYRPDLAKKGQVLWALKSDLP
jgi:hypothetical protein